MRSKLIVRSAFMMLVVGAFAATLSAQQVELYPYAGGFWPRHTNFHGMNGDMRNEGIYGLKVGAFLDQNVQLEGSFGYINHFESRIYPTTLDASMGIPSRTVYSVLYDVNGTWNFGQRQFMRARVSPYLTLGGGGLTAAVRHANSAMVAGNNFMIDATTGEVVPGTGQTIMMSDGDTFLTLNYGGGIKAMNLWGPVGLRADVRGRSLPNFYGKSMHWPELTGGLTFTWGER